jgi:hypothetical protein
MARDELNREIDAGRVLKGYRRLEPNFPPTFKVCHPLRSPSHSCSSLLHSVSEVYRSQPSLKPVQQNQQKTTGPIAAASTSSQYRGDTISLWPTRKPSASPDPTTTRSACPHTPIASSPTLCQVLSPLTRPFDLIPPIAFEKNLELHSFESCEEVSSSDHKPVFASFSLQTTGGLKDIMVGLLT